ncbi:type IV pilus modification PilV family protein [Legionella sp. WA2022007384]
MSKQKQSGFSIIELIVFIVTIGIIVSGLLIGINQAQRYSGIPRGTPQASFLANARMQIILMNRDINGYTGLDDPCTSTPSLDICMALSNYALENDFVVSDPTILGSNPKVITLNVTGSGSATINARVYNYANN